MGDYKNQHYIPKFYFRNFSDNQKLIDIFTLDLERFIYDASIKSQAAGSYFYGDKDLESLITVLENSLWPSVNKIKTFDSDEIFLSKQDFLQAIQYVVFQKYRTLTEREKAKISNDFILKEIARVGLEQKIDEKSKRALHYLDKIKINYSSPNNHKIAIGVQSAICAVDLGVVVAMASGDSEFIFGDSPAIFYNHYLFNVKVRGVLGLQTPGLLMFFPISPKQCLIFFDKEKYNIPYSALMVKRVIFPQSDVDEINKLQILNSRTCIYFRGQPKSSYIKGLWNSIKQLYEKIDIKAYKVPGYFHGETESFGEVMHTFEPQVNYLADFSFIKNPPMPKLDPLPHFRNETLASMAGTL